MANLQELRHVAEDLGKKGRRKNARGYWAEFPPAHLMGWLLHGGQCVYCGSKLVELHQMRNAVGGTDHLLPKRYYPELEEDPLNLVPVCAGCNGLKRGWDPNAISPKLYDRENEDRIRDEEAQKVLISRAKEYIDKRRNERDVAFPEDEALWSEAIRQWRTHLQQ